MEEIKLEPIEAEPESDTLRWKDLDGNLTDNFNDVKPFSRDQDQDHPEPFVFVKQECSDFDVGHRYLEGEGLKDEKPKSIFEENEDFIEGDNGDDSTPDNDLKEENCGNDDEHVRNEIDATYREDSCEPSSTEYDRTERSGGVEVLALTCESCHFQTRNLAEFTVHTRTHYQPFEHKCPRCIFSTPLEFCLKRHLDVEHSKPKYKHPCYTNEDGSTSRDKSCNYCEFRTNTKKSLRQHIKYVHLKLRTHCCQMCDFGTQAKEHLERHVASVHLKIKSYACSSCDFKTNRVRSMWSHMKRYHEVT